MARAARCGLRAAADATARTGAADARVQPHFSDALIAPVETPASQRNIAWACSPAACRISSFRDVNRDTADVLLANGCEVVTPRAQSCCGSLHAHNGELELAQQMARRNIDAI